MIHIAVDVGGTRMRAASYQSSSLKPIKLSRINTKQPESTPLERMLELITTVWPEGESIAGLGVAVPGPLDPFEGKIIDAPNIPNWENLPLRQILEDRFKVPVVLGNDANSAALGECKFGAGMGHHHLIYLTVSTGIGSGVIIDDKLLLGASGFASELGHVTVLRDGPLCPCGQLGHLEAVASGTAIARWVEGELDQDAPSTLLPGKRLTAIEISAAAQNGDPLAKAAIVRAGEFIGQAIADFLHVFNPSIVIIGGGVSQSGRLLLEPVKSSMQKHVMNSHFLDNLLLTTASLGDEAGLMGALVLAREMHTKES
jgi:glucokinase